MDKSFFDGSIDSIIKIHTDLQGGIYKDPLLIDSDIKLINERI